MISSNEVSAVKPSARARVAARPGAQPDTMRIDRLVRLAADQHHRRITCDATQRLDLFPDGRADARHRQGPVRPIKAESIVAARIRQEAIGGLVDELEERVPLRLRRSGRRNRDRRRYRKHG